MAANISSPRPAVRRPGRALLVVMVLTVAAAAWIALVTVGDAHAGHGTHGTGVTALVGGWLLMTVAMMLPPALPMLDVLRTLASHHERPARTVAAGAWAFVSVWAFAGLVLLTADVVVRAMLDGHLPPAGYLAAVLALAGIYQFTPLKRACLRACRTPRGFAVAYWRGIRSPAAEAATVARAYAWSCVGCCWALMAVMLAVGSATTAVMVVLAVVMAAERLLRHGRRLIRPVGVALLLLAGLVLAVPLPLY